MKNDTPVVSILVPICNVEKYLRYCLKSLVRQTLTDIQIICIDDGSTDFSPAIIEEYAKRDPRIEVITKSNSGYGDSMNKGLAAARGEYIAIVESDDFIDEDALEWLVDLARSNDAEVVKANFYTHASHTDYHDDPVLPNLEHCHDKGVFDPEDDPNIFLTQPAIWSAIYRRDFLEKNEIRFLPTPGASFQDTSFNFKVFACAHRVLVSDKAFLHYRIDNSNSSVKQLSKVFCICDEYEEMWRFLEERNLLGTFGKRLAQIQYGGYYWNLHRLTPNLQYAFYQRFVEDFRAIEARGLLDEAFFDKGVWTELSSMLADPDAFFKRVLGPIEVATSVLVHIPPLAPKRAARLLLKLAAAVSENDEIVCFGEPDDTALADAVAQAHAQDARIFAGEERLASTTFQLLSRDEIRGDELRVLYLNECTTSVIAAGTSWLKHSAQGSLVSDAFAACSYEKERLSTEERPLLLPLLARGFYAPHAIDGSSFTIYPEWILRSMHHPEGKKAHQEDYQSARGAFDKLISSAFASGGQVSVPRGIGSAADDAVQGSYHIDETPTRVMFERVLVPLWAQSLHLYNALSYNDRMKLEKPSPLEYPSIVIAPGEDTVSSQPDISVIIPVFNAEEYLLTCLESVLCQENVSFEVICIDDGSGDNSIAIMEQIAQVDSRMRVYAQLNGGAGVARNRGISLARGRYLAFIDPDDLYPSSTVLHDLFDAAQRNNAKMCGGSFMSFSPEGEVQATYYGNEAPYSIFEEGFRTIDQEQFDYGWIRFIYERSLFAESGLRFPALRWYEDPVFFVDAVTKAGTFYLIPEPTYLYREDYKEPSWSAAKIRDMLIGIDHNLRFAREHDFDTLYTRLIDRIDHDYGDAILAFVDDEEVLLRMTALQSSLEVQRVSYLREQGYDVYVLNPLYCRICKERKTAVRRIADKVESSRLYETMQSYYERYRKR